VKVVILALILRTVVERDEGLQLKETLTYPRYLASNSQLCLASEQTDTSKALVQAVFFLAEAVDTGNINTVPIARNSSDSNVHQFK